MANALDMRSDTRVEFSGPLNRFGLGRQYIACPSGAGPSHSEVSFVTLFDINALIRHGCFLFCGQRSISEKIPAVRTFSMGEFSAP
jgi:hypothetical protein